MSRKFEKVTLVHVVMSNDFPDCVFTSKHLAEEYCRQKEAEQVALTEDGRKLMQPRIYYRSYVMELRDQLDDGRK